MGKSIPSATRLQDFASRLVLRQAPPAETSETHFKNPGLHSGDVETRWRRRRGPNRPEEEDGGGSREEPGAGAEHSVAAGSGGVRLRQEVVPRHAERGQGRRWCHAGLGWPDVQLWLWRAQRPQKGRAWINKASKARSSVWRVSDKQPGYNASDSDSGEMDGDKK